MSELTSILEQAQLFAQQHVPAQALTQALPVAGGSLIVGLGVSILGAKFSRAGLTTAAAVIGGWMGVGFANQTGYPVLISAPVGAIALGIVGFQTIRTWVGLATGVMFAVAALGVFGYRNVLPRVGEYEQQLASVNPSAEFTLPTPEEQRAFRDRTPVQWLGGLYEHAAQSDPALDRQGKAIGAVALLTGLCFGLLLVRPALILTTSLLGTSLVMSGLGTLMSHFAPDSFYQALDGRPGLLLAGAAGFFVTSLVLQTLMTLSGPKAKPESPGKPRS